MHVIEEKYDETLWRVCRTGWNDRSDGCGRGGIRCHVQRRSLFDREPGNYLWLVLVEDLKVFSLQVANRAALCVAYYHRDQYHIHLDFDFRAAVGNGRLGGLLAGQRHAASDGQARQGHREEMSRIGR